MTTPGFKVRISFDLPADGIGATWYDISSYVRYIRATFGRSQELDEIEAATARVVLVNTDGRFTPGNTAGPYGTDLRPFNQLEIRWTSDSSQDAFELGSAALGETNATLYDTAPSSAAMFRGLIDSFSPTFHDSEDGGYSEMTITAFDFLGWLQKKELYDQVYSAQTVGARIAAVLTAAGNPFPTDIDTGGPTLAADTLSFNVLAYIRQIVDLDAGIFYCRGGTLVYVSRETLQATDEYLTSQLTLGDQDGQYRGTDLRMTLDESKVVNRINGVIYNGVSAITEQNNTLSQSYYMVRERDFGTTALQYTADLEDRAALELALYSMPLWRIEGLDFNLLDPNLDSSGLIELDLFDRVTVARTPSGGDAISMECHFQGVEHEVYPGYWKMTISVSSAPEGWTLGKSELGVDTELA